MDTHATTKTETVHIVRTFKAPTKAVWQAWTEENAFKKWWGPVGFTCPNAKLDVRVGGTTVAAMQDPNGKKMWSSLEYTKVVPQERLVYTDHFADDQGKPITPEQAGQAGEWPDPMVVTVTFTDNNGVTQIDLRHTGIPADQVKNCTQGWNECLDKQQASVEQG